MGRNYLVTGGSGHIGFAVLKLLTAACSDGVEHVRVLDLYFPPALVQAIEAKAEGVTVEWYKGDVTKPEDVLEAVKDCDTVLHLAGIIPGHPQGDRETMWNVNVEGTRNVVDACCLTGVTALIHISTINVVGPNMNFDDALLLEESHSYNNEPMSWYGYTKKKGEEYVLQANGRKNREGKTLTTCSLRPPGVYGETYSHLKGLYDRSKWNKTVLSTASADARLSFIYVGNVAWAIIHAALEIRAMRNTVGGEVYFIRDDTPDAQPYEFFAQLYSRIGFKVSKRQPFIPFLLLYILYTIAEMAVSFLHFCRLTKQKLPPRYLLSLMNSKFTVSHRKFVEHFAYKPRFSPEAALENTRRYIAAMAATDFREPSYDYEMTI